MRKAKTNDDGYVFLDNDDKDLDGLTEKEAAEDAADENEDEEEVDLDEDGDEEELE